MTTLVILNLAIVPLCILGMYLIAHKNKLGFVVFFAVEVSFAYIGYCTSQYGIMATSVAYFLMNIYSYKQWNKHKWK